MKLPFTGNVRELKNLVERTMIVSGKHLLGREDFEAQYIAINGPSSASRHGVSTLEDLEREKVVEVLEKHGGNVSRAAGELGLSRAALYRRMEKYGINEI